METRSAIRIFGNNPELLRQSVYGIREQERKVTMSRMIRCDRCGSLTLEKTQKNYRVIVKRRPEHIYSVMEIDLCRVCFQTMDAWIKTGERFEGES